MFGAPDSWFAYACLLVACSFVLPAVRRQTVQVLFHSSRRAYVVTVVSATFALSLAYVHYYLRGGPRIIDATSYWLQAHTFALGSFSFPAPGPLHSFAGRFLVVTPNGELAVLFPPGFAALLTIGVWAGAPMLINPILGSLSTVLTFALGTTWFGEKAGRVAGLLSALCAVLRYHSADTMSHMLAACLSSSVLLALSLHPPSERTWRYTAVAGLCAGWLFATRPLTGLIFGVAGLALNIYRARKPSGAPFTNVLGYVCGTLPGLGLWFAYQHATTGSFWSSTQSVYYARSDWPADCFRLGFGAAVGCQFEHGDFLDQYQPGGYSIVEALAVTARRLYQHNRDIVNLPWVPVLTLLSLRWIGARPVALSWALLLLHFGLYSLFYFDGNYPGGGARLFVEVLSLEHVLLALVLTKLRWEWSSVAVPALGFALWSHKAHQHLAEREGGRPMFENTLLERAGVDKGLIFVTTDHGFNLGLNPEASPHHSPLVVRLRGDAFDHAVWQHWGSPPSYRYELNPFRPGGIPRLTPFSPPASETFAGASFWPPIDSRAGGTAPSRETSCPFAEALQLQPSAAEQEIVLQLWVPTAGPFRLSVHSTGKPTVNDWPLLAAPRITDRRCGTFTSDARNLAPGPFQIRLRTLEPISITKLVLQPAR